jgi:hypothetical protein
VSLRLRVRQNITNRDRADILRDEDPLLASIDWSIGSLGHALGASDERMMRGDGGGVQASPASVVANYFLQSHGGAHALQCACSLLATLSGLGAILFHKRAGDLGCTLLQRTMLFAMIKHVSGLLVAASLAAKAIPKIGLGQARVWMEKLVLDPVSQYVFYTSLVLLWLPSRQRWMSRWWASFGIVPTLLVGPILLREMISTMLVVSDVLVLWSSSSSSGGSSVLPTILKLSQSTINAGMSLMTTPGVWRPADPAQRQAILAKLVAKASLTFEVLVGLLFAMDFVIGFLEFAFRRMSNRPSLTETIKRLLCVRLYVHFLWVRRQPIQALAIKLRGGAAQLPFWILDTALHPATAMGITLPKQDDFATFQWNDYAAVALALDNE